VLSGACCCSLVGKGLTTVPGADPTGLTSTVAVAMVVLLPEVVLSVAPAGKLVMGVVAAFGS